MNTNHARIMEQPGVKAYFLESFYWAGQAVAVIEYSGIDTQPAALAAAKQTVLWLAGDGEYPTLPTGVTLYTGDKAYSYSERRIYALMARPA